LYRKIDHVAIAVRSIESALKVYAGPLGFQDYSVEEIGGQKTRVALLPVGESRIELLEAIGDDSPVAGFISKRGEGLHHICFEVDDLAGELEKLRNAGLRIIEPAPRRGAEGSLIAFVHPSGTCGVLVELCEPNRNKAANFTNLKSEV